ncbi:hypothetical protein ACX27_02105 [Nostoc piscinale CENA21]|uniref:Uncharacterized protein n=1 Tax=Nostoc piscinale CENA21 TaxID=224013 RepID=A0A0M4T147_9NOSO|nr:hypothetical protein [Nostoc piscinale]ALF51916.1 hypothetical protein ACX27_02105 [Nostoc piscinale CENA21]
MGRWTPLILMGGGLAILLGTLLGINFPMGGGQQTASNNAPGGKTSRVLPANINVNSTAPSRGSRGLSEDRASTPQEDNVPTEARGSRSVRQENLNTNTTERRTSVAQNTTPSESFSTPDNTSSEPTTREVQSTETQSTDTITSDSESTREPIRALW